LYRVTHAHAASLETSRSPVAGPAAEGGEGEWPPLVLYNTMMRRKEPFTPRVGVGNKVSMYCCGVTVYDLSHIGEDPY
jgi:hypothetical protein